MGAIDREPSSEEQIRAVTIGEPQVINGPIELADYDERWPGDFAELAAAILGALGPGALLVEHVGSTSVPGLAAKPIVDVLLTVADSADEPAYVPPLERLGYTVSLQPPAPEPSVAA